MIKVDMIFDVGVQSNGYRYICYPTRDQAYVSKDSKEWEELTTNAD